MLVGKAWRQECETACSHLGGSRVREGGMPEFDWLFPFPSLYSAWDTAKELRTLS